jgi:hypothetical protein
MHLIYKRIAPVFHEVQPTQMIETATPAIKAKTKLQGLGT